MRLAITVWRGCVSPLFEAAGSLLLVRLGPSAELDRIQIRLSDRSPAARAQLLWLEKVELLICGALSRSVQRMLEANGIRVIGWIRGEVEEVLAAFDQGRLDQACYQLPGGRRQRQRRRGGNNGRRQGA